MVEAKASADLASVRPAADRAVDPESALTHDDPEIQLLTPEDDCDDPVVSLVVPALNEQITIGMFVDWCKEGLKKANVKGEILIVDSSNDKTPQIAVEHGARVLRSPRRGLGRAYIDALPFIRGKYVILGDCDCTYDFRELVPFLEEFEKGAEFIMGSRFRGTIEEGAMPPLHRYFGTPLTTWILNWMYGCHLSDIHCGMRGLTRDAYARLNMQSQKWEYASEMIIKAVKIGLRTAEVPIHFLKDQKGRSSHLKTHWYAPWVAGWQNLRVFFLFRPDFFLRVPGYLFTVLGLALTFGLAFGPITLGRIELSLYSQIFGLFLLALGTSFLGIDALTTLHLKFDKRRCERLKRLYDYDRVAPLSALAILAGSALSLNFVAQWVRSGFVLLVLSHGFATGLGLILIGFQLFLKSLTITLFGLESKPDKKT